VPQRLGWRCTIWCTAAMEGYLPTALVYFELFFYGKLSLVSSTGCCQFGGCESITLNLYLYLPKK
jgi:hypothetical protein